MTLIKLIFLTFKDNVVSEKQYVKTTENSNNVKVIKKIYLRM